MNGPQFNSNRQILEEASMWFVDFRLMEIDKSRRADFMVWLQRSPDHIRAYMEIAAAYARLPAARSVDGNDVERLIRKTQARTIVTSLAGVAELPLAPVPGPGRDRGRRRVVRFAASISALVVCTLVAGWLFLTRAPLYATTTAEHRSITLDDGSKLELNARTRVRIDFREHERRIDLLEGQVLFQVAKDPLRPFIVSSGGAEVRAVGTRFDVRRRKSGTTVTVLEGRVAVQPHVPAPRVLRFEAASSGAYLDGVTGSLELTAGEQVIITPTVFAKPTRPNVTAATAWTKGELEFDDTPLRDVVEEFNRYSRIPVVIDTPALGDFRISGVCSSEDPSAFIHFLQAQPDLVVIETSTEIRVRHR